MKEYLIVLELKVSVKDLAKEFKELQSKELRDSLVELQKKRLTLNATSKKK